MGWALVLQVSNPGLIQVSLPASHIIPQTFQEWSVSKEPEISPEQGWVWPPNKQTNKNPKEENKLISLFLFLAKASLSKGNPFLLPTSSPKPKHTCDGSDWERDGDVFTLKSFGIFFSTSDYRGWYLVRNKQPRNKKGNLLPGFELSTAKEVRVYWERGITSLL